MATVSGGLPNAGLGPQQASASLVNSFRLAAVADRLEAHLLANGSSNNNNNMEFFSCCISLAKGIDYAIANDEIPAKSKDLPSLVKQICLLNSDDTVRTAVMVLMISIKNACKLEWFAQKENEELLALANQIDIDNGCGRPGDLSTQLEILSTPFSQIMERFYPFVKMGHVLASLEVKPGYATLVVDFHITKKMPHSFQEKIRLFVAQTNNIETSSCIVSPPLVNFVVNGKAVEKRTNVCMENGPQLPTDITKLLKFGTNLLQVVGQLNAHSIVAIAFTDVIPPPETPVLKDYVQSSTATSNSDSDIIEGPSRISLNCPISRSRIRLPIKGQLCKHLQCFDFGNYADINSRMPTWRCPHCNQPVSYTDIRVDQNMVKVLAEVADNVADIIISDDGSWKAVMEIEDKVDDLMQETENDHSDPSGVSNICPQVLDLTGDDDEMGTIGICEVEERKPSLTNVQDQSAAAGADNTPIDDDFFSGLCFPDGSNLSFTAMMDQFSAPTNNPAQQSPMMDEVSREECLQLLQRSIIRNPLAIQALHVPSFETRSPHQRPTTSTHISPQAQTSFETRSPHQRPTTSTHISPQAQTSPVTPVGNVFSRSCSDMESSEHFSRVQLNPLNMPSMTPSRNHIGAQNLNQSELLHRMHPVRSPSPGQLRLSPGQLRLSPGQLRPSHGQLRPSPGQLMMPSPSTPQSQTGQGFVPMQQQQQQIGREVSGGYSNGTVQSVSRMSELVETTATDTNWRPMGRMRGSLVPGSYSSSLDQIIIRPTADQSPPQASATQPSAQLPPLHHLQTARRNHPTAAQTTPGYTGSSQMRPPQNSGTL